MRNKFYQTIDDPAELVPSLSHPPLSEKLQSLQSSHPNHVGLPPLSILNVILLLEVM